MLLITTALMIEARPLASGLSLKAVPDQPFPVFSGRDELLIVTGTGTVRMAAATGWAFGRFDALSVAVNIGYAGASLRSSPLHEWYYVSSIRDSVTDRLSLPDILQGHPFKEQALLTVPAVMREESEWNGLVDMEGSGFYEAARRHLSPDRIALLKWVSDSLTGEIDVGETTSAFADGLDPILEFVAKWPEAFRKVEPDPGPIEGILSHLRLTQTQELFLEKWISGFLARGGELKKLHALLPPERPCSKKANTKYFEELKNVLKG